MTNTLRFLAAVLFLTAGLLTIPHPALAQSTSTDDAQADASPKWVLRAGVGTMISTVEENGGAVSVEIGRHFDTGFVGSLGVTRGRTSGTYPSLDVLFAESPYDVAHTTVHLGFAYSIPVYRRHTLTLGTGAVYTRDRAVLAYADLWVDASTGEAYISEIGTSEVQDANAGMLLSAEYLYRWSRVDAGLRAHGHLLYDVGIRQFVVGPVVGVRF